MIAIRRAGRDRILDEDPNAMMRVLFSADGRILIGVTAGMSDITAAAYLSTAASQVLLAHPRVHIAYLLHPGTGDLR